MKEYIDDAVKAGIDSKITYKKINELGKEVEELVNSKENINLEKE